MPRMKNLLYKCGRDAEKHACFDTRSAWALDSMRAAWVCDEKEQVMDGYPVDHLPVEFRPLPRRGMSLLVFRLPLAPGRESGERGSCFRSRLRVCCSRRRNQPSHQAAAVYRYHLPPIPHQRLPSSSS
jgi:hypothetical protein